MLNFKVIILIFSLTFLLGKAHAQGTVALQKPTTLKFIGGEKNRFIFFYADKFNDTDGPFVISNNQTVKRLSLEKPVLLFDATTGIPYYILPGEELQINSLNREVQLTSSSKNRNDELAFFPEFNKKHPEYFQTNAVISLGKKLYAVTYPNVEHFENTKKENGLAFLEYYKQNRFITEEFYVFVKQFFHYLRLANIFTILSSPTIKIKNPPTSLSSIDSSINKSFTSDSCLDNMMYRMSASAYRQYLLRHHVSRESNSLAELYDLTLSHFIGQTREFLLFISLKERLNKGLQAENPYYIKYLATENNNNSPFINYLKNAFRIKESKNVKNELLNLANETTNWEELMARYRGRLIFVDFWASWCLPCRKEFPYTKALSQKFKPGAVCVLYISTDENYNACKKAVTSENIENEYSFIINHFKTSELKTQFKIESLPRYLLIDKFGNIILEKAPHPSSPELIKLISKYL